MQTRPYKLLDYYEPTDEAIFFGREQEAQLLSELIDSHRQVLLFGASGNGKTSLLLAGVTPLLQYPRDQYEVVYVRLFEQPEAAVRQAVQRRLGNPPAPTSENLAPANEEAVDKIGIFSKMEGRFNDTELNSLIFELGFADGIISGDNLPDKIRQLVEYVYRRGRLEELHQLLIQERPHIFQRKVTITATAVIHKTSSANLAEFLEEAAQQIGRPIILILDQFEELFNRINPDLRSTFISDLGVLTRTLDIPVKLVISLREEMLASMSEIEAHIPSIFHTKRRLLPLSRQQAYDAVIKPLANSIRYEQTAVEQLLDDLTVSNTDSLYQSGQIMPTHLQLVCNALYERVRISGHSQITLVDYKQSGEVQGILGHYLDEELHKFHKDDRQAARLILEELVSSTGNRQVATLAELAHRLNLPEDALNNVLQRLIQSHLIRLLDEGQTVGYELVHDFLAQKINMMPEVQVRKAVEEMVKQELQNWGNFDSYISPDRLQIITSFQDQLLLTPEAESLIQKSQEKQTEAEEFQIQLIQTDKLNFLSQLAAGIDKEISSPITNIDSNSRYLRQGMVEIQAALPDDPGIQELLVDMDDISDELEQAAKKMKGLIHALSNFALSDQQIKKPVDLHTTLDAALLLLEYHTLKHEIRIQRQYTRHLLQVMGIPGQLVHLFMNVWMNNLEAITAKSPEDFNGIIKIKSKRDSTWCIVEFNFFGQAKNGSGQPNRGFDLQIAAQIARNHAGTIEFKDNPGNGTTFVLRLPLIDQDEVGDYQEISHEK
ncbi:MAG: hypothetical protein GY796_01015 [Chloroflexi bacterium]|nr:hypothetical protein [Chloroflexota bacterium]